MIYNNIYQFYCQHLYVKPKNTCQRVSGWFWVEYRAMLMLKWYIFFGCKYDSVFIIPYMTVFLWFWPCMSASCLTVGAAFFLCSWLFSAISELCIVAAYSCFVKWSVCWWFNITFMFSSQLLSSWNTKGNPLKKTMEVQILLRIIRQYGNADDEQRWSWIQVHFVSPPSGQPSIPLVSLLEFPTVSWFPILCPIIYYKE